MGMFSWFTSDEQERIIVDKTFDIYMTGKDGRIFHQRTPYKGYGVFGGKDFHEYLAELNGLRSRKEGIDLALKFGELPDLEARGYHAPRLFSRKDSINRWDRWDPPLSDPNQGSDIDDSHYDDDDEDYDHVDFWEKVKTMKIKIKEDSTIHLKDKKMVLEAGEQYKIVSLSEIEKEEEKAKFKEMGLVYHDEGDAKKEELENMSFSEFGRSLHEQGVPSTSALGAKRRPIKLKQFIEAWDKYAQSYGFDGAKDVVFLSILGKKAKKEAFAGQEVLYAYTKHPELSNNLDFIGYPTSSGGFARALQADYLVHAYIYGGERLKLWKENVNMSKVTAQDILTGINETFIEPGMMEMINSLLLIEGANLASSEEILKVVETMLKDINVDIHVRKKDGNYLLSTE
jgi:hypothetical protein